MPKSFQTISPVDGSVVFEGALDDDARPIERARSRRGAECIRDRGVVSPLGRASDAMVRRFVEAAVADEAGVAHET